MARPENKQENKLTQTQLAP